MSKGGLKKGDETWKRIQQRTFTNWTNDKLRGDAMVPVNPVGDLQMDLKDGIRLIELLEVLAHPRKVGPYTKKPKIKAQYLENIGTALGFISKEKIKLVNISGEDLYGENLKLVLGLIWTLICHYQIRSSGKGISVKKAMLMRLQCELPEYHITNFNTNLNDGRVLCGMVDNLKPGLCPNHFDLDKTKGIANCQLGLGLAQESFGIPQILSAEDLNNPAIDDLSVMTYLSYFLPLSNKNLLAWLQRLLPKRNIKNLTTDWIDGVNFAALLDKLFSVFPEWERLDSKNKADNMTRVLSTCSSCLGVTPPLSVKVMTDPMIDEMSMSAIICMIKGATLKGGASSFTLSLDNEEVIAGENLMVRLTMDDEAKPELFHHLSVFGIAGKDQVEVAAAQVEKKKEYLLYKIVPSRAGSMSVYAKFQDKNVKKSPRTAEVAIKVNPACFSLAIDNQKPLVNQPLAIQVNLLDAVKPDFFEHLTVEGIPMGAEESETIKATLIETTDSHVMYTVTPLKVGKLSVTSKFMGVDVSGSPVEVTVVPQVGPGLFALRSSGSSTGTGEDLSLFIDILEDNVDPTFLDNIAVFGQMDGKEEKLQAQRKKADKRCVVYHLSPNKVGVMRLYAQYNGTDVANSPFVMQVNPALNERVRIQNLPSPLVVKVKEPFLFNINSEVPLKKDDLRLSVQYEGKEVTYKLIANSTTEFVAEFTPTQPGRHSVDVMLDGCPIKGAPFELDALDPKGSQVLGDIPEVIHIGDSHDVSFLTGKGSQQGGAFKCWLESENKTSAIATSIAPSGDTGYTVTLTGEAIGLTAVNTTLGEVNIQRTPFTVSVVDSQFCKVDTENWGFLDGIFIEDPIMINIDTENAGKGRPEVYFEDEWGNIIHPKLYEKEKNKFCAETRELKKESKHKLNIKYGGHSISGSPWSFDVNARPEVHCHVTGPGLTDAVAKTPAKFKVLSTELGAVEHGQLKVSVEAATGGYRGTVDILDNDDKSYTVTYTCPHQGLYLIKVIFYDEPAEGSPFKVNVLEAANSVRCRAYGPALEPKAVIMSGEPTEFYVDASQAGTGKLMVVIRGKDNDPNVYISDDGQGIYSVKFDIAGWGRYYANVWWGSLHIPGSPFPLNIHREPNASLVRAYGPGVEKRLDLNHPATITIETKDAGRGTLNIRVRGVKDTFSIQARQASADHPRTLLAEYHPNASGVYQIQIKWQGKNITGSPFRVHVYDPASDSELYEDEWVQQSESSEENDYSDEEERKQWRRRKQRRDNRRRSGEFNEDKMETFYHGNRRPSWKTVDEHMPQSVKSTVSPGWTATPTHSKKTATKYYTSTPLERNSDTHEAIAASEKHTGQRRTSWTPK
uniref:Filamin-like 10 n=1 Tax=Halisarca dujardinii TaxID=2583056 RepID=A0A9F1U436_HALDU|nr:filamin-like 10 [Halisarca dujardinii]